MVALVVADAMLDKFGGDSLTEFLDHIRVTRERWDAFLARRGETP